MINKTAAVALSALVAFGAMIPVMNDQAEARRWRGAGIAAGVVLGAAALALLANQANARNNNRGSRAAWARQCDRWYNSCMNGNNLSCERFETRGCTE
jgi:hypothetical protein